MNTVLPAENWILEGCAHGLVFEVYSKFGDVVWNTQYFTKEYLMSKVYPKGWSPAVRRKPQRCSDMRNKKTLLDLCL